MQSDIFYYLGRWIIAVIAAERIAEVIVDSTLLSDLRATIASWAQPSVESKVNYFIRSKISYLVTCGWCASGWTSLLCSFYIPHASYGPLEFIIIWFGLYGIANYWHAIFRLTHRGRVISVDLTINIPEEQGLAEEWKIDQQ